ncbi:hypothetical protein PSU4_34960 [Pseudonocardia sulfidoxydans NBRC 16205]|uniref:Uncharacterized protein n=1 Tax=Pseudonocardia sulfidoxydans NBRC 16205 TaxID=1223511 RepID=A0A511DIA3_9PSEU|nr:hypothetical protein PSU4_34960 [Pseudonocardia sulfidoxydans NBRC 16205]
MASGCGAAVRVDDVVAVAAAARRTVPRVRGAAGWAVSERLAVAETRLLDGRGARRPVRRARAEVPASSADCPGSSWSGFRASSLTVGILPQTVRDEARRQVASE